MVKSAARLFSQKKNFLDSMRIYVRGGGGGTGLPKFGGSGGRGGHVYVVADPKATLAKVKQKYPNKRIVGGTGKNSTIRALAGESGTDAEIVAPLGVCIFNDAGALLGELNEPGDKILVAKGGQGGQPETNFQGTRGHALSVRLDLKLIADVGLVGFPNAGKSTLLSAISRAAPKIAAYPFTTIQPQIGIMQYDDLRQISMADLPGLIEGAHVNVGMGHHFLKHVERTKMLLFMIDIHGFQLGVDYPYRTAFETIMLLNKELEMYKPELVSKPAILALNKTDLDGSQDKVEEVLRQMKHVSQHVEDLESGLQPKKLVKFDDVIPISAKKKEGTDHLKVRIRELLDHYADLQYFEEQTAKGTSKKMALVEPSSYLE